MGKDRCDFIILFLGLLAIIISLFISLESNEMTWFMRSGVFGILSSVVVEYRSIINQVKIMSNYFLKSKVEKQYSMMGFIDSFEMTPRNRNIKTFSYSMLFLGTLVTGYGDIGLKLIVLS